MTPAAGTSARRHRDQKRFGPTGWHAAALLVLLSVAMPPAAWSAQVCTTTDLGGDDFNGISGSGDADVIAVGKDGAIVRWDGAAWTAMSAPVGEDLFDVEVVAANVAFAVGKKGTALFYDGVSWSELTTPTDKDLNGVWADSAADAWAVGKNGTLLHWDGSAWSDVSTAANTDGKELVDAWGDANNFYGLDKDGRLYRYDRVTGSWDAPDDTCDVGGRFEDLWGDGSGVLHLVGKRDVYRYDGATCVSVASASKDLLGVYGAAGHIVAVGKDGRVLETDGTGWVETDEGVDDFRDVWVSDVGNAYYAGKKGEVTTCECSDCVVPGLVVVHDGYGLYCLDEPVRVDVVDTISGSPYSGFGGDLVLDTQSGAGTWALVSGGGTFSDATVDDGLAAYSWGAGDTTASFALSYRRGATPIDVDVYEAIDPASRDDDSEGALQLSASGFSVTAAALPNPPPAAFASFAGPVTAGTDFALHITAYGQTPADPVCGVIESYTGARMLSFWSGYNDPATGTIAVVIDGSAIAGAEGGAAPQPVSFVNGQGVVTARYKDAGRIRISMKDDSVAHPDLPAGIRGATLPFVSKPARFVLSNIVAGATPNPAAADAGGPVFVAAGDPFAITVTALDAQGDPTPNFGRESVPETVALATALVDPVAGNNPALLAPTGFGAFAAGQATGTDFAWPEVGIVQLTPSVGDADYLGAGNVIGDTTGNVGRFVPHHFATAVNAPVFDTACSAGGFTYSGEGFGYNVAPVITITAESAGNTTTANYTSDFWKLDNATLANRLYTTVTGTLDLSGLPPVITDPVIVDAGSGVGTLTFSSGSGLRFVRSAPQPPFDADIALSIDVIDADAVAAAGNPVSFGMPGGIAFAAGRNIRYGRIAVASALGSERVDLPVPMQAQYYLDAATGFVANVDEVCAASITLALTAFAGNLGPGNTCVMDAGTPGLSGAGCVPPAPAGWQYRSPALAGDFNLNLAAPGVGNDGALTVVATVPAWLRYDWDTALPGQENPSGRISFGIFRGDDATVYFREVY